jgi:hypothetical protein
MISNRNGFVHCKGDVGKGALHLVRRPTTKNVHEHKVRLQSCTGFIKRQKRFPSHQHESQPHTQRDWECILIVHGSLMFSLGSLIQVKRPA